MLEPAASIWGGDYDKCELGYWRRSYDCGAKVKLICVWEKKQRFVAPWSAVKRMIWSSENADRMQ